MTDEKDSQNILPFKNLGWDEFEIKPYFFLFVLWCLLVSPFVSTQASEASTALVTKKLIIGTKQAPPFSFQDSDGQWNGISIELWEMIAKELDLEYEYKEYDLTGLLSAVENRSVNLAVAALTITSEREKRLDFTHPFHTSGLGIAVVQKKKNVWLAVFNRFFSLEFLKIALTLSLLLFSVGLLVWFFEKKKNPEQFGGSALSGVGSGFWWSAVTMTTVGYGDKTPKTFGGRVLGIVWMFMAIIIISSFTAAITSTLTIDKIQSHIGGPQDLHRVAVGSLKHSTSASYLNYNQIFFQDYASVKDALNGLLNGEIDAVVYDAPILRYLAAHEMQGNVLILRTSFEKQQYGIALPAGSLMREEINQLIPSLLKQKEWQAILIRYLREPGS